MADDALLQFAMAMHTQAVKAMMDSVLGDVATPPPPEQDAERCGLGRWLEGDGARYAALPAYTRARDVHRQFHAALSDVVGLAKSGARVEALARLRSGSDFSHLSNEVVAAFDDLAKSIGQLGWGAEE